MHMLDAKHDPEIMHLFDANVINKYRQVTTDTTGKFGCQ
jgi:hypothetical protein